MRGKEDCKQVNSEVNHFQMPANIGGIHSTYFLDLKDTRWMRNARHENSKWILNIVKSLPETVALVIYGEVRIICHVVNFSGFIDYAAGSLRVFLFFEGCD